MNYLNELNPSQRAAAICAGRRTIPTAGYSMRVMPIPRCCTTTIYASACARITTRRTMVWQSGWTAHWRRNGFILCRCLRICRRRRNGLRISWICTIMCARIWVWKIEHQCLSIWTIRISCPPLDGGTCRRKNMPKRQIFRKNEEKTAILKKRENGVLLSFCSFTLRRVKLQKESNLCRNNVNLSGNRVNLISILTKPTRNRVNLKTDKAGVGEVSG